MLYGVEFNEAADVLRIYIWSGLFVSIGVVSSKWLVAKNLEIYSFYSTAIGAILNVIFNLWLIPIYGILGATLATLISYSTVAYFSLYIFTKTRKNFWVATHSFNPYGVFRRILLYEKNSKKNYSN